MPSSAAHANGEADGGSGSRLAQLTWSLAGELRQVQATVATLANDRTTLQQRVALLEASVERLQSRGAGAKLDSPRKQGGGGVTKAEPAAGPARVAPQQEAAGTAHATTGPPTVPSTKGCPVCRQGPGGCRKPGTPGHQQPAAPPTESAAEVDADAPERRLATAPGSDRCDSASKKKPSFEVEVISITAEVDVARKRQSVDHRVHAVAGDRACRRGLGSPVGVQPRPGAGVAAKPAKPATASAGIGTAAAKDAGAGITCVCGKWFANGRALGGHRDKCKAPREHIRDGDRDRRHKDEGGAAAGGKAGGSMSMPFAEALAYARTLRLTSQKEWRLWSGSGLRPGNLPAAPDKAYKHAGWQGFAHWLGVGVASPGPGPRGGGGGGGGSTLFSDADYHPHVDIEVSQLEAIRFHSLPLPHTSLAKTPGLPRSLLHCHTQPTSQTRVEGDATTNTGHDVCSANCCWSCLPPTWAGARHGRGNLACGVGPRAQNARQRRALVRRRRI